VFVCGGDYGKVTLPRGVLLLGLSVFCVQKLNHETVIDSLMNTFSFSMLSVSMPPLLRLLRESS